MEPQGEVWWQERDRPESRFYRRGCNPALMGVRVGENELGGNQKWVGGAQRGMSPVTSEVLSLQQWTLLQPLRLHEVCFTKMPHRIELCYLKNGK